MNHRTGLDRSQTLLYAESLEQYGVRTKWSLITLVYNLKRVLKLVSFEKLMQAVG